MADDLLENLESYRVQLQQVEAALIGEPDNEELLKLKEDLEEVIALTTDLAGGGGKANGEEENDKPGSSVSLNHTGDAKPSKDWKVGDACMAVWSKNGQYYDAVVDGISEGKAAVTFIKWNTPDTNNLTQLRLPSDESHRRKNLAFDPSKPKRSKGDFQLEKEKKRKKALRRIQKVKELEQQKEGEKNKWKNFNNRALAKSYKGVKKSSSIFASSDTPDGRVGVGTCGIGGKEGTKYRQQAKFPSRTGGDRMDSLF